MKFGFLGQIDRNIIFRELMDEKYGRAKKLSRMTQLSRVERAIYSKRFRKKYSSSWLTRHR